MKRGEDERKERKCRDQGRRNKEQPGGGNEKLGMEIRLDTKEKC